MNRQKEFGGLGSLNHVVEKKTSLQDKCFDRENDRSLVLRTQPLAQQIERAAMLIIELAKDCL
jgi:hypothetical protein